MKVCTKCKVEQPYSEFHKAKRTKDGYQYWCRACFRERWYADTERNARNAKAYRDAHREELRVKKLAYCEANRGREAERARRWSRENPDKKRAGRIKWDADNPQRSREIRRMILHRRQAREKNLQSFVVIPKDVRRLLSGPCAVAGCMHTDIQVDHVIPVARGGSSGIGNYQSLCAHHNRSKGSKTWFEFRLHLARKESLAA